MSSDAGNLTSVHDSDLATDKASDKVKMRHRKGAKVGHFDLRAGVGWITFWVIGQNRFWRKRPIFWLQIARPRDRACCRALSPTSRSQRSITAIASGEHAMRIAAQDR